MGIITADAFSPEELVQVRRQAEREATRAKVRERLETGVRLSRIALVALAAGIVAWAGEPLVRMVAAGILFAIVYAAGIADGRRELALEALRGDGKPPRLAPRARPRPEDEEPR